MSDRSAPPRPARRVRRAWTGAVLATTAAVAAPVPAEVTAAATDVEQQVFRYPRPQRPQLGDGTMPSRPDRPPTYRFLSAPDFMNLDLGDVRTLPRYRFGSPTSWNRAWARTVDTILDTFEAERPHDVLVAGDLVAGHWGTDVSGTGTFGPVATTRERSRALRRAADFYFSRWRARFRARGLSVYAAVGDHDIGDNSWSGSAQRFKRDRVHVFKRKLAEHVLTGLRREDSIRRPPAGPARRTAYAVQVAPEVLVVTVDVFKRTPDDVVVELDRRQLRWLDRVLARAEKRGTDWVFVQGHTPVLTPVRAYGSSSLTYLGGRDSAFWQVMAEHEVDAYLCGEVHDISLLRADGITQIAHGGKIHQVEGQGRGGTSFVVADVHGKRMWLRVKRFAPRLVDARARLWQVGPTHWPVVRKLVWDRPPMLGRLVLTKGRRLVYADGLLAPYLP